MNNIEKNKVYSEEELVKFGCKKIIMGLGIVRLGLLLLMSTVLGCLEIILPEW